VLAGVIVTRLRDCGFTYNRRRRRDQFFHANAAALGHSSLQRCVQRVGARLYRALRCPLSKHDWIRSRTIVGRILSICQVSIAKMLAGCFPGDGGSNPCWSRPTRSVPQVGGESDPTPLCYGWIHQVPYRRKDANDCLILRCKLSLETVEPPRQRPVRFEQSANPHERSHDLDVYSDGTVAREDRRQHRDTLLRKRVRGIAPTTAPGF
jgi:hypothetical protein